eukprot:CAMPEP_0118921654 /NCGR_PEP_ID=MMETSP1169-20130426/860_1 /TAXON_ID=36882 /ORGANISM="Pyramimonas obovata, Strain CCMP722" /LENGTH=648 /DNA_ID=CAMNT_0006862413 /DNA_START=218 /DNA_END=2161 /DNA_ORIENTATION=+
MALSDYEDYDDDDDYEQSDEDVLDGASDSDVEDADEYGFEFQKLDEEKPKAGEDAMDKITYTVMGPQEIAAKQHEIVQSIQSVLSVSPDTATMLLRHFKWSVNRIHEEWFQDEDKVREKVGLLPRDAEELAEQVKQCSVVDSESHNKDNVKEVQCNVCFDTFEYCDMRSAECGHLFCLTCWRGYLGTAISDGPCCLRVKCPQPNCKIVVKDTLLNELADREQLAKLQKFRQRSFVEDQYQRSVSGQAIHARQVKWCPAPECVFAVKVADSSYDAGTPLDIDCLCGHQFCYNCNQEAHRPVDCVTVKSWLDKNSAESENMNWILANSKQCPKCFRHIEKNQGCMHMTCSCRHEFCWLCLGPWQDHGDRTGGFYACNRYEDGKQRGEYDAEQKRRDMAKASHERYMHYYERWAANEKSQAKAKSDLADTSENKLNLLSNCQSTPLSQLKFVTDAQAQIVECRRILKWTYGYGYCFYDTYESPADRHFFEFMQGNAECVLEKLSHAAEHDLAKFMNQDMHPLGSPVDSPEYFMQGSPGGSLYGTSAAFDDFRSRLTGLTAVTKNHFQTLVQALERERKKKQQEAKLAREQKEKGMATEDGALPGASSSSRGGGAAEAPSAAEAALQAGGMGPAPHGEPSSSASALDMVEGW